MYVFSGNNLIKKWRNIKDNYNRSLKKKTKSGQAADSGRRYIFARQLSFLQTAGATTETQSSLGGNDEEEHLQKSEEQPGQNLTQPEGSERPQRYDPNSSRKRKRDMESCLIDFMKAPIPSSTVAAVPEPNPDRSFFESILPSISDFTEDQKLEFRCEILNMIKRMRMSSRPQNYGYPPNISYHTPLNASCPTYPIPHSSNYLPQTQSHQSSPQLTPTPHPSNCLPTNQSQQSSTQDTELRKHTCSTSLSQALKLSGLNFKPLSPSGSSFTSVDNQSHSEEDSLDIFTDGH